MAEDALERSNLGRAEYWLAPAKQTFDNSFGTRQLEAIDLADGVADEQT